MESTENTNGLDSGRWTLTEVWSALTGVLVAVQVGELLGGHACALRLAVPRRGRRRRQGLPLHAVTLDALFSTCFNIIIYNKYCRILHSPVHVGVVVTICHQLPIELGLAARRSAAPA